MQLAKKIWPIANPLIMNKKDLWKNSQINPLALKMLDIKHDSSKINPIW